MCECRQRIEKDLAEHMKKQLPAGAQAIKAELNHYAMIFGEGSLTSKQYMPVEVTYQVPTKAGVMKDKKKPHRMLASFCMFCGEKYPEDGDAAKAA